MIRAGLGTTATGEDRRRLHLLGAAGAAGALATAGLGPAMLARVAEAVLVAGVGEVAALRQPVPDPNQAQVLRWYLSAAAEQPSHPDRDAAFARWLGVVCVHLAVGRLSRPMA